MSDESEVDKVLSRTAELRKSLGRASLVIFSATQSASIVLACGLFILPVSISEIRAFVSSVFPARASCDKPSMPRLWRTSLPNKTPKLSISATFNNLPRSHGNAPRVRKAQIRGVHKESYNPAGSKPRTHQHETAY